MLHTDPEGKKVFTDSQPTTSHFTISHHTQDIPSSLTIPDIKAKIAELQKQLAILEVTCQYYYCIIDSIMHAIIITQKTDRFEENGNHFNKIPL